MQDRVSQNPGRVLVTPEDGTAPFYVTLTRADNPTQEGDPLCKATFLKDATAALFGLTPDAVPDDALALLSRFHKGLGNEYVWEKALIQDVVKFGSSTDYQNYVYIDAGNWPASVGLRTYYSAGLPEIVLDNGVYKFKFADSIPMYGGCNTSILSGKWISTYNGGGLTTECWYIPDDESLVWSGSNSSYNATCTITKGTLHKNPYIDVVESSVSYVNSPNPNAYPPAVSDGYTYTPLGQLGAKVQIATGNYTGTGTYGSSNPNSLTFDFEPKVVFVGSGQNPASFPYVWGAGSFPNQHSSTTNYNPATVSNKKLSWYNTSNSTNQLNQSGIVYYWVAIG